MLVIDKELLDGVTAQAKASPRLRMNYNLHDSLEAKAQRLMNAMEPGTDLPIHRHTHTAETYFSTFVWCQCSPLVIPGLDIFTAT